MQKTSKSPQIAYVPWSIKAFIGSLSDLYPLYGYHAQGYMLFFSVLGSAALFLIGVLPLEGRARLLAPALIFLAMMQISVLDLLCEARYARAMKEGSAKSGGSIISFVSLFFFFLLKQFFIVFFFNFKRICGIFWILR